MESGIIPDDALAIVGDAGLAPYFIPDLKFIDTYGLTDATIARNPVIHGWGILAHERQPPPGYLAERGVNFVVHPPAPNVEEALRRGLYAVQVGPALWMPFDAPSREWVAARFVRFEETLEDARLLIRGPFSVYLGPEGNLLLYVKDGCDPSEPIVFLHVVPVKLADLVADRQQYGFENLDFTIPPLYSPMGRPRLTQLCVMRRELPDYPIAAIRTGQYMAESGKRLWEREFRFGDSGHAENPKER